LFYDIEVIGDDVLLTPLWSQYCYDNDPWRNWMITQKVCVSGLLLLLILFQLGMNI